MNAPVPVADLDAEMRRVLRSEHRSRWLATSAAFIALTLAVVTLGILLATIHGQQQSSCAFFRSLTPLSVTPIPPVNRPSRFAVTIVADSRLAYEGLGCAQAVAPLSPSEKRWAAYYHINPH